MIFAVDSSSLISLASNCILDLLDAFKKYKKCRFIIGREVYRESIENPLRISQYSFEGYRIKNFIDKGTVEVVDANREIVRQIFSIANSMFIAGGRRLHILHRGECEAIALAVEHEGALLVDERTARMILENPFRLRKIMERKLHKHIAIDKKVVDELFDLVGNIRVFRSVDLLFYAYKKGIYRKYCKNNDALYAAMYALKLSGCAVTVEEIKRYLKILSKK